MEDKVEDLLEIWGKDLEKRVPKKELEERFTIQFLGDCCTKHLIVLLATHYTICTEGLYLLNAIRMKHSIDKFEKSSSKLTRWLIAFTVIIALLTAVLVVKDCFSSKILF
jgi:hypothetical protein